jgi:hypothetical protein
MRSQQTARRWYSNEFKQVVLRPLLGIKSLKKAKEFLAKCRFKVACTSLVDVTVEQRSFEGLGYAVLRPSYSIFRTMTGGIDESTNPPLYF